MQQLKYILKYILSLLNEPEQTWKFLTEDDVDEAKLEYMQTNYYLPMMGVVAVLLFFLAGWGDPFSIERAMKQAVSFVAAFFVSPYLASFVLNQACEKLIGVSFNREKLQVFVAYSLSFLMTVDLLKATFPHIKFLAFFALYMFYIVWCASDGYFGLAERNRWKFTSISFFVIWLSPILVTRIMTFMMR